MKKVRPDLGEFFEPIGITVDGKKIKPCFEVNFVPQQSTWLLTMVSRIDGEDYCTPEYSNTPEINHALIIQFCYGLETIINAPKENRQEWCEKRDRERPANSEKYYN